MKKILTLASLLILSMVVFAACGNRDRATEHSQGVTDTTIYVGNTADTSGMVAFVGVPFIAGMEAYFAIVNEAGGVHGRNIQLIHREDGSDMARGIAMTTELIEDDRVFALVGHFGGGTIGATLPMIFESGIPAVYFASGIGALHIPNAATVEEGQRIFPVQPIFEPEGYVLVARAASEYNVQRIGLIFSNDEQGQDLARGARSQAQALGIEIVEMQVNPGDAVSVVPAVLTMRDADVDAIVVATIQTTFPLIVNELAAQGVDVPVFTSYVSADAATIAALSSSYLSAGATFPIYATAWLDIFEADGSFTQETIDFMVGVGEYLAANAFAMAGWAAASVFVEGLRAMGDVEFITWEGFTEAMENNLISIPMGGMMDFSNGVRTGTTSMTLNRADVELGAWVPHRPFALLSEIVDSIN